MHSAFDAVECKTYPESTREYVKNNSTCSLRGVIRKCSIHNGIDSETKCRYRKQGASCNSSLMFGLNWNWFTTLWLPVMYYLTNLTYSIPLKVFQIEFYIVFFRLSYYTTNLSIYLKKNMIFSNRLFLLSVYFHSNTFLNKRAKYTDIFFIYLFFIF